MSLSMTLRDIGDSIRSQPTRFALSFLAIGIGVISLVLLLAVLSALNSKSERLVQDLGVDVVGVLRLSPLDQNGGLSRRHAELLKRNFEDLTVSSIRRYTAPTLGTRQQLTVVATDDRLASVRGWSLAAGRFLDRLDVRDAQRNAVVTRALSEEWGWRGRESHLPARHSLHDRRHRQRGRQRPRHGGRRPEAGAGRPRGSGPQDRAALLGPGTNALPRRDRCLIRERNTAIRSRSPAGSAQSAAAARSEGGQARLGDTREPASRSEPPEEVDCGQRRHGICVVSAAGRHRPDEPDGGQRTGPHHGDRTAAVPWSDPSGYRTAVCAGGHRGHRCGGPCSEPCSPTPFSC